MPASPAPSLPCALGCGSKASPDSLASRSVTNSICKDPSQGSARDVGAALRVPLCFPAAEGCPPAQEGSTWPPSRPLCPGPLSLCEAPEFRGDVGPSEWPRLKQMSTSCQQTGSHPGWGRPQLLMPSQGGPHTWQRQQGQTRGHVQVWVDNRHPNQSRVGMQRRQVGGGSRGRTRGLGDAGQGGPWEWMLVTSQRLRRRRRRGLTHLLGGRWVRQVAMATNSSFRAGASREQCLHPSQATGPRCQRSRPPGSCACDFRGSGVAVRAVPLCLSPPDSLPAGPQPLSSLAYVHLPSGPAFSEHAVPASQRRAWAGHCGVASLPRGPGHTPAAVHRGPGGHSCVGLVGALSDRSRLLSLWGRGSPTVMCCGAGRGRGEASPGSVRW